MEEYNGKIGVSKDTMLFVTNDLLGQNIKKSISKEDILKLIPEIYEKAEDEKLIEMLPYKTYKGLEKIIEYTKTNSDIENFLDKEKNLDLIFLQDAMIIIRRAKHLEYNYSLNPGVIEKLKRLFSRENKIIAKRYGEIENLTLGMLYSYGIVDFDFLRKQLGKYINEKISETELRDIYFTRLNLNQLVKDYNIRWTNTNEVQYFVTYLDEDYEQIDVGKIAEGQKSRGMKYKQFSKQEILKREEYLWNERTKKLYNFIKTKNKNIYEWQFENLIKENELGIDILKKVSALCGIFEDETEVRKFVDLFMKWYNNSPQYVLGGYSPIEFRLQ